MWLRQCRCRQSRHTELKVEGSITWAGNQWSGSTVLQVMALTIRQARRCCTHLNLPAFYSDLSFNLPLNCSGYFCNVLPLMRVLLNLKLYWNSRIHVCKTSNKKSPFVLQRGLECGSIKAVCLECSIDWRVHGIKSKQQEKNSNKGAKYIKSHSKSTQHDPYCTFRLFISNIKGALNEWGH